MGKQKTFPHHSVPVADRFKIRLLNELFVYSIGTAHSYIEKTNTKGYTGSQNTSSNRGAIVWRARGQFKNAANRSYCRNTRE
jgi:hypothetical protein